MLKNYRKIKKIVFLLWIFKNVSKWQLFSFAFEFKSKTQCFSCFTLFFLQLFRCYWGTLRSCQGWSGTFVASCSFYLPSPAYLLDKGIHVKINLTNLYVLLLTWCQNPKIRPEMAKEMIWRWICLYWVQMVSWDTWKQVIQITHVLEKGWELNVYIKILNV